MISAGARRAFASYLCTPTRTCYVLRAHKILKLYTVSVFGGHGACTTKSYPPAQQVAHLRHLQFALQTTKARRPGLCATDATLFMPAARQMTSRRASTVNFLTRSSSSSTARLLSVDCVNSIQFIIRLWPTSRRVACVIEFSAQ